MNYYKTSSGERKSKKLIDDQIRIAKKEKLEKQFDEHGYNFCEECKRSSGVYLDCSHDISVDRCQKEGRAELAYSVSNITIRCRDCHMAHD